MFNSAEGMKVFRIISLPHAEGGGGGGRGDGNGGGEGEKGERGKNGPISY